MTPVLVTPPADGLVSLSELKVHLRVDGDDEDALISGLAQAAVAWLDGWNGVLGRAILTQTWRQDFEGAGPHLLALPDATIISTTVDGDAVDVVTEATDGGLTVTAEGITGTLRVTYACALPSHRVPLVRTIVLLMVAHWYAHRESVQDGGQVVAPLAADALISSLRWRRV